MRVGDICRRTVTVAAKGEPLVDAAKRMRDADVDALVVVASRDGCHVPMGLVTQRDVISALVWQPSLIGYLLVVDAISDDLVTVQESEGLATALRYMEEYSVRQLPVVDGIGKLVGLLTLDDVLEHLDPRHSALVTQVVLAQRRPRVQRL